MRNPPALPLVVGLALASCTGERASPAQAPTRNVEFVALVDEYFDWSFEASPSSATYVGIHQFDDRLDDLSRPAIEARIAQLEAFLGRLMEFDESALSFDEQIDARALESQMRAHLELADAAHLGDESDVVRLDSRWSGRQHHQAGFRPGGAAAPVGDRATRADSGRV